MTGFLTMEQNKLGKHLLHGGDYNPEQWLDRPDILEKDIELMKKAHINTVTLGIFAWAALEPEEGKYNFEWLEKIMDHLYENGISVILATPSGARPKWLADRYPEVLRVDEQRRRRLFGKRHNHCYTSPVYREKVQQIDRELAMRFGHHPAVIAWHISNELQGECHCPLCQQAFRKWLRKRYGTVENLNRAWNTAFWSHTYQSFEQVESPSSIGESGLHGLNLDWKRFVSDRTADFLQKEIEAIRSCGATQPATTNMMYRYRGLNYDRLAEKIDFISWDSYPTWDKKDNAEIALDCGMQHDYMRSLKGKPFVLMESCPSATNWQSVSKLKKPGMLLAASLHALAHGSDSVLYFQIRQSPGASEKFHGAVIDHYGESDTRVFHDVTQTGQALEQLEEVTGTMTRAQVAVICDTENIWAMEDAQGPRNKGLHVQDTLNKVYTALRKQALDVDVISMDKDLSDYQLVVAPMAYMFREGFADKAREFVHKGGTFVLSYWSGIVDQSDLCYLGGWPAGLMDVAGYRSTEIDSLYDWESNSGEPVEGNPLGLDRSYECKNLCELVKVTTAQSLLTYGSDFYKGMPALTVNHYGQGALYDVCADFSQEFYDDFFCKLVDQLGMERLLENVPEGVEVCSRENENIRVLFIQNFNAEAVDLAYPQDKFEILWGSFDGQLQPLQTLVLKQR